MSDTATQAPARHLLETYTGRFFDYANPQPEQINLRDIAHSLALTCRYGGHCSTFYSVAEHSVLVSRLLEGSSAQRFRVAALLHDAHEAYLGDLPTPLKNAIGPAYRSMVNKADAAIAAAVGVKPMDFHHPAVVWADAVALRLEAHKLKFSGGEHPEWDSAWEKHNLKDVALLAPLLKADYINAWSPGLTPEEAESTFVREYKRLTGSC